MSLDVIDSMTIQPHLTQIKNALTPLKKTDTRAIMDDAGHENMFPELSFWVRISFVQCHYRENTTHEVM
jgi:hypothetical protein